MPAQVHRDQEAGPVVPGGRGEYRRDLRDEARMGAVDAAAAEDGGTGSGGPPRALQRGPPVRTQPGPAADVSEFAGEAVIGHPRRGPYGLFPPEYPEDIGDPGQQAPAVHDAVEGAEHERARRRPAVVEQQHLAGGPGFGIQRPAQRRPQDRPVKAHGPAAGELQAPHRRRPAAVQPGPSPADQPRPGAGGRCRGDRVGELLAADPPLPLDEGLDRERGRQPGAGEVEPLGRRHGPPEDRTPGHAAYLTFSTNASAPPISSTHCWSRSSPVGWSTSGR